MPKNTANGSTCLSSNLGRLLAKPRSQDGRSLSSTESDYQGILEEESEADPSNIFEILQVALGEMVVGFDFFRIGTTGSIALR